MNRREWFRRAELIVTGIVAADQLELLERLTHVRTLFPSAPIISSPLTLADWAKRDPKGVVPNIIDLLTQTNEILLDTVWIEGQLPKYVQVHPQRGLPVRNQFR